MSFQLEVRVHEGVGAIEASQWDRLVAGRSPFLEHGFLTALEDSGCLSEQSGWYPQILGAYESDRLVGALPFYIKAHSAGEFVFDWAWAEGAMRAGIPYYPKAVVAVPFTPVTGPRLLYASDAGTYIAQALVQAAIEVADRMGLSSVHFNFLTAQDVAVFESMGLPIRLGIQYHWENRGDDGGPFADFDDYLKTFRSKRRANIRRERRKLVEQGVTTRVIPGSELTDADMDRLYRYYRTTVNKFYWGRQYLSESFFHQIRGKLSHRLHAVIVEREGKPFGGTFNLFDGQRLYGRYWGCVEEVEFAHFEACIYRPVQWCIENGVGGFEPGAGGEHKYERGFAPTLTYSAHYVRDPRLGAAVEDFIAREREGVMAELAHLEATWRG
jgi:uncharacterized protein